MVKDLNYWKENCAENYMTTPISVLRYITELEDKLEETINSAPCCDKLKVKKGTDFEEFCSEHFIHKNNNIYYKKTGKLADLQNMLDMYKQSLSL